MRQGLVMVCDVDLGVADAGRTHTIEVARGFAAQGLDVDLVARGPDPEAEGVRYTGALGTDRQRIRRVLTLNARVLRLLWRRRRTARRLYVRHRWTLMAVECVGRALGYSLVTQIDDLPDHPDELLEPRPVHYLKRAHAWLMGQLASGVVAVTPEIKALLATEFHVPDAKIEFIPNGVDVDFFRPLPREEAIRECGLDPVLRYVLFCGNFAPWVDFATILEGFAIVSRQRAEARLLLVGDGSERDAVERRVRELGIEEAVIITGLIRDRTRVRQLIAASTVTVSANRLKFRARIGVSPVKLGEYLASGRAVVATDLPGLRQTLEETRAGIVVPVNPAAFADAILQLIDPVLADEFGANGRRVAEERFAWSLVVRRTIPLFRL